MAFGQIKPRDTLHGTCSSINLQSHTPCIIAHYLNCRTGYILRPSFACQALSAIGATACCCRTHLPGVLASYQTAANGLSAARCSP